MRQKSDAVCLSRSVVNINDSDIKLFEAWIHRIVIQPIPPAVIDPGKKVRAKCENLPMLMLQY